MRRKVAERACRPHGNLPLLCLHSACVLSVQHIRSLQYSSTFRDKDRARCRMWPPSRGTHVAGCAVLKQAAAGAARGQAGKIVLSGREEQLRRVAPVRSRLEVALHLQRPTKPWGRSTGDTTRFVHPAQRSDQKLRRCRVSRARLLSRSLNRREWGWRMQHRELPDAMRAQRVVSCDGIVARAWRRTTRMCRSRPRQGAGVEVHVRKAPQLWSQQERRRDPGLSGAPGLCQRLQMQTGRTHSSTAVDRVQNPWSSAMRQLQSPLCARTCCYEAISVSPSTSYQPICRILALFEVEEVSIRRKRAADGVSTERAAVAHLSLTLSRH